MEKDKNSLNVEIPDIFKKMEIHGISSILEASQISALGLIGKADKKNMVVVYTLADFANPEFIRANLPLALEQLKIKNPSVEIIFY